MARPPSAAVVAAEGVAPSPQGSAPSAPLALASVPFRGGYLVAVKADGEVFVPLRPVAETLGLTMQSQLPKLRRKPWATIREILTVAEDGKARAMVCLSLRALPLWLATIDASKVKPEVKPALLALQVEAADVLYRHFLAPPAPVDGPALAQLAADLEELRGEVRELRGRTLRRTREPAPLGIGRRLNADDAARVRAYCATRPIVATEDAMREALGLTTWTNVEASALAAELRELGYDRRKTYLARGCQKWRWRRVNTSPLSLVSVRAAQLEGGCA